MNPEEMSREEILKNWQKALANWHESLTFWMKALEKEKENNDNTLIDIQSKLHKVQEKLRLSRERNEV